MDYEKELILTLETMMFESMFCGFIETTKEPIKTTDAIYDNFRKAVLKIINHKIEEKADKLNETAEKLGLPSIYDAENIRVDVMKALKRIDKNYWNKFRGFAKQVEDSRGI